MFLRPLQLEDRVAFARTDRACRLLSPSCVAFVDASRTSDGRSLHLLERLLRQLPSVPLVFQRIGISCVSEPCEVAFFEQVAKMLESRMDFVRGIAVDFSRPVGGPLIRLLAQPLRQLKRLHIRGLSEERGCLPDTLCLASIERVALSAFDFGTCRFPGAIAVELSELALMACDSDRVLDTLHVVFPRVRQLSLFAGSDVAVAAFVLPPTVRYLCLDGAALRSLQRCIDFGSVQCVCVRCDYSIANDHTLHAYAEMLMAKPAVVHVDIFVESFIHTHRVSVRSCDARQQHRICGAIVRPRAVVSPMPLRGVTSLTVGGSAVVETSVLCDMSALVRLEILYDPVPSLRFAGRMDCPALRVLTFTVTWSPHFRMPYSLPVEAVKGALECKFCAPNGRRLELYIRGARLLGDEELLRDLVSAVKVDDVVVSRPEWSEAFRVRSLWTAPK